ncbi:MAG: glycosyltransferase family 4 protein [Bacteroidetes bacterium]|nr:glycosyltransferase family 4 protein [Bacteroidota bacterium]
MKVVYFYQYFSTPNGSWGTRVYEFAKKWVEQGHEVTVVSSIYSKSDLKASKLVEDQFFEGIHVKVINVVIDNKQATIKRIRSFILYGLLSSYYALTLKADVVVASSGPITVGLPGLVARYLRGRKLLFETRDLWPETAIELGILKNKTLQKLCYWFERCCYKASSYIVTLSPGMTKNINQRFGITRIDDVTNAANIALFSNKVPFQSDIVQRGKFAVYTGNIGMVNNSYWLYGAAKCLKEAGRDDIKIVLIGEGQQREELEQLAKQEGIDNFIRLGLMPKTELVGYVQSALVSLVPLKGTPVLDTSSPNKLFESLAAGVPVIQNTNGWLKDFLKEHQVGFTLDPENPKVLADQLIWMDAHPEEVKALGKRSYEAAIKYFDKDYLADKMLKILEKTYASKR